MSMGAAGGAARLVPSAPALRHVLRDLRVKPLPPGAPAIAVALIDPPPGCRAPSPLVGRGVDRDPALAETKAAMEAMERYLAYLPPRGPLRWAALQSIAPAETLVPLPPGEERWWCRAREVFSDRGNGDRQPWLPLECVQVAASPLGFDRAVVRADSTGMAVHPCRDAARRIGLAEALERAALARLWRRRGATGGVWAPEDFPASEAPLVALCREIGYDALALPVSPAPGFTAVAVLLRRLAASVPGPVLVLGSGGGWDPRRALIHALHEAFAELVNALELAADPARPHGELALSSVCPDERAAQDLVRRLGIETAEPIEPPPPSGCATPPDCPLPDGIRVLEVERGTELTDALGLAATQIVLPQLPPFGWLPFEAAGAGAVSP